MINKNITTEKAIEILKSYDGGFIGYRSDEVYAAIDLAINALDLATKVLESNSFVCNVPLVQSQRPHGEWLDKKTTIKGGHGLAYGRYGCSICKKKQPSKTDFCPCCGADMRGKDNDNK